MKTMPPNGKGKAKETVEELAAHSLQASSPSTSSTTSTQPLTSDIESDVGEPKGEVVPSMGLRSIVWGRVGTYPFWPGKISRDPMSGDHVKVPSSKALRTTPSRFHVTFYGTQPTRSWLPETSIMPFVDDEAAVEEMAKAAMAKYTATGEKTQKAKESFAAAVTQARHAIRHPTEPEDEQEQHNIDDEDDEGDDDDGETEDEDDVDGSSSMKARKKANGKTKSKGKTKQKAESIPHHRDDDVCVICHGKNPTIACSGPCRRVFHANCLNLAAEPQPDFTCEDCLNNTHKCFHCGNTGPLPSIKCSSPSCGRFYHLPCVSRFPSTMIKTDTKFVCPSHTCARCPDPLNLRTVVTCTHCPLVYHKKCKESPGGCVPCGSKVITPSCITCPKHVPKKLASNHDRCDKCDDLGSLLCCESCPRAFHPECLTPPIEEEDLPTGAWICSSCAIQSSPSYGDVVWAKLGSYRPWPAKIPALADLPDNFVAREHDDDEIPVYFLGSKTYSWIKPAYVQHFVETALPKKRGQFKGRLGEQFEEAFKEAVEARQARLREVEAAGAVQPSAKPFYLTMKKCRYVPPCEPGKRDRVLPCICPSDGNCGEGCINRDLRVECVNGVCPAGADCLNRRFQHGSFADVEVFYTQAKGWAIRTKQPLQPADFIMEYIGEIIDPETCAARLKAIQEKKDQSPNFYFLTLDHERIIDASTKGNAARFINHSCDPNCETQKWSVNGQTRVGIFAKRPIQPKEELTFDYQFESVTDGHQRCFCGAHNCSGFIGKKPTTLSPSKLGDKSPGDKKRKKPEVRQGTQEKEHPEKKTKMMKILFAELNKGDGPASATTTATTTSTALTTSTEASDRAPAEAAE